MFWYFWPIVTKSDVSRQIFVQVAIKNFMKICPVGTALIHAYRKTDGRTDRHYESNRSFSICVRKRLKTFRWNMILHCPSQWPRGLRRGSAANRLLRLWVQIPTGYGCLSVVSVLYCQVEASASGWLLLQRSRTQYGVSECNHDSSIMRKLWSTRTVAAW
jgi:hypothetical protein